MKINLICINWATLEWSPPEIGGRRTTRQHPPDLNQIIRPFAKRGLIMFQLFSHFEVKSRFQASRIEPCRLCGSLSHFAQVDVCQHGTFDITQADHILLGPSYMGGGLFNFVYVWWLSCWMNKYLHVKTSLLREHVIPRWVGGHIQSQLLSTADHHVVLNEQVFTC